MIIICDSQNQWCIEGFRQFKNKKKSVCSIHLRAPTHHSFTFNFQFLFAHHIIVIPSIVLVRHSTVVAILREWKYCHITMLKSSNFWLFWLLIFKRYFSMLIRYICGICCLLTFPCRVAGEDTDLKFFVGFTDYRMAIVFFLDFPILKDKTFKLLP